MNTKSLRVEVKDEAKGTVKAVFSTLNQIDSDNDVTIPGAFIDGQEVVISAYGHTSWEGKLPVGVGTIRTTAKEAILEGQFFLDTTPGADTFKTVKALGRLGQWSYGYDVTKHSFGEFKGQQVRFLEGLNVHEVSPVLVGAGVNTRTLAAKSAPNPSRKRTIEPHETSTVARSWDGAGVVAALAADARPSELRGVFAWVDGEGDPELKSSYRLAHHHGVGGPANIRACLIGIAALNGKSSCIPDDQKQAVYDHLAGHLRDADREPPELRSGSGASLKFGDELLNTMAVVAAQIDSAARVVALRAEKGKTLSMVNTEILGWIADDLKRLNALLTTPVEGAVDEDELNAVFMASLARIHDL